MNILSQLVAIESLSGKEQEIQRFIANYLSGLGLDPFFVKENLVVKIAGKNASNAIIFNAHVDTVPPGDAELWHHPPLAGEVFEGKVYGLGASDEKAAIATLLLLAESLAMSQPACDVWLTFVVREELDGSGSRLFVQWFTDEEVKKYTAVSAILGEPTNLAQIELAHKGNIFLKITTIGDSGHASRPQKIKKHAVREMYVVAKELNQLSKSWRKRYADEALGRPTIGLLTSISAGDSNSPNKFPDACVATFDVRTTPGMHEVALEEIKKAIPRAVVEYVSDPVPYGKTDKSEEIAQITKRVTGGKFTVSSGSNDMCFFTGANIPAVVFGPGDKSCIHKANEFCQIDKVEKCAVLYKEIIEEFGMIGQNRLRPS